MCSFTIQLFTAAFLATATIVWSSPVQRRQTESLPASLPTSQPFKVPTTFKVSNEAIRQLIDIRDQASGLLSLWKMAKSLTKEAWLAPEVNVLLLRMRIATSA